MTFETIIFINFICYTLRDSTKWNNNLIFDQMIN